jgi:hypothetical protein
VVNLNFIDNASNENWVDIERCQGAGCTNFSKIGQTLGEDSTGFRDSNVSRGTTYTYRARAVGFMGFSEYSNTSVVTLSPLNPPAAPSNLTSAMSGANVVLNWQDNSDNEMQFDVERCQGAGCNSFTWYSGNGANAPTLIDNGAAAGVTYSYRVRAWNFDGFSAYSNTTTIVTPGGTVTPPLPPSSLTGQALSKSQIGLSWTNNSANQDGVRIERCSGSNCTNFAEIATVAGTSTTFVNSGLAAATTYRYRVRAYNAVGISQYSNIAAAKTSRR